MYTLHAGQIDAFASTVKAAAAPKPIHELQLEAKSIPSKQTLSMTVERPLAPLSRPSNTHARASIHTRLPHQPFQPMAISPNQ